MEDSVKKYFIPEEPASFTGINSFRRHHPEIRSSAELAQLLSAYPGYTLHKPTRHRFPRNRTIVSGINAQWQMDLASVERFARYNDGTRYLLCVIDVFSKRAWVIPLQSKQSSVVLNGLKKLFSMTDARPQKIQTDRGGEFTARIIQQYLESLSIKFFTTFNEETKASISERFIRTIMSKISRYLTFNNTYRYLDALPKLVESYNNTYHRTIRTTPNNVTKANEKQIWSLIYGDMKSTQSPFKFEIGDIVRILSTRAIFRKSYETRWSRELFRIKNRLRKERQIYHIEDFNGEMIKGSFYAEELQKVRKDDEVFIVEKVLGTRRRKGKQEYLVRWAGWPSSFDSWVDDIVNV